MKGLSIIVLGLLILVEAIAEYFINLSNTSNKLYYLYIGMVTYLLVAYLFYLFLKFGTSFAVSNTIWQVSNIIILSLVSYFIFKERLTKIQWFGIFLAIISVLLIDFPFTKSTPEIKKI